MVARRCYEKFITATQILCQTTSQFHQQQGHLIHGLGSPSARRRQNNEQCYSGKIGLNL